MTAIQTSLSIGTVSLPTTLMSLPDCLRVRSHLLAGLHWKPFCIRTPPMIYILWSLEQRAGISSLERLRSTMQQSKSIGDSSASSSNHNNRNVQRRTFRVYRLLQTELLAGRQKFNRLANAPFSSLRPFGGVNPHNEISPVRWGKRLKMLPCFDVRLECFANVGRQHRDRRT